MFYIVEIIIDNKNPNKPVKNNIKHIDINFLSIEYFDLIQL